MILMGDEVRRTQFGNNNAYCQDNETSWFDWTLLEKHADVHRFVSLAQRAAAPAGRRARAPAREPEPAASGRRTRPGTASSSGSRTGAITPTASRFEAGAAAGGAPRLPDPERVLGAAGLRAAAGGNAAGRAHGADGSIPRSNPRRTSSRGRWRLRYAVQPIGRRRAPSSCCSGRMERQAI